MIFITDAEEAAAERHYGLFDLARALIDYEVVDQAEPVALAVIDGGVPSTLLEAISRSVSSVSTLVLAMCLLLRRGNLCPARR